MSDAPVTRVPRYQRWSGRLSAGWRTWIALVTTGIRLAYHRSHVRFLISMSLGFIVGTCAVFYVISFVETLVGRQETRGAYEFINTFLGVDLSGVSRMADYREVLWKATFMLVIKIQLVWVLIVVGRIGPGLIADDLKSRALPIYFARPLQPLTYLTGKWMVAAAFIAVVTLVPNLVSLIVGTMMTGGAGSATQTLALAGQLSLSGAGLMVIGGALILALSSLSADKRYVTIGWLAVCILPLTAQSILTEELPAGTAVGFLGSISLSGDFTMLTEWLLGLRRALEATPLPPRAFNQALGAPIKPIYPAVVLLGVTVASLLVCYWRVLRFSRAAANV